MTALPCLLLLALLAAVGAADGDDVVAALARARSAGALRVAAIGGSITQAGNGWIAPWLAARLPGLRTSMRNAGWSGTGSELGTFRLARDVIAADPDLVLIETAVNDGHLDDDEAIRSCESLVRRLAELPRRPGIVMVLAAAKDGARHARHRAVAAHYGLVTVDLQAAMAQHQAGGGRWEDCFTDSVHLNEAGNALYAKHIAAALEPLLDRAPAALAPLPTPLARLPLRLDGRMWTPGPAPGWSMRTQVGEWWDCFLLGSAEGRDPAQPLVVPVRGTAVGIHVDFGNGTECGTLLASLDGGQPVEVPGHLRGGGEALVLGRDLPPGEHLLTLAVAPYRPGPVRVAYVLAGGGGDGPAPAQGPWSAQRLASLRLAPVPGNAFRIAGPVGGFTADVDDPAKVLSALPLPADPAAYRAASVPGPDGPVAVRRGPADPRLVFAAAAPWRGTAVAVARFRAERDGELLFGWAADYFGAIRLNGVEIVRFTGGHGGAQTHAFVPVQVRAGWNELMVVLMPGSRGFACDFVLEQPGGNAVIWETE